MTALAGVVGSHSSESLENRCAAAIAAHRRFGGNEPVVRTLTGACFGLSLIPTLPEDAFDRQPLADTRHMLVADVRLDNRVEVLRALGEQPPDFGDRSDADVLFLALKRWGEGTLDRIAGGYAFAFYDADERRLLLARDPAGEKPLCYTQRDGLFCFASMPSGLIVEDRPSFDLEAMAVRLNSPPAPAGRTSFRGVSTILPGHKVRFDLAGTKESNFWQPGMRIFRAGDEELVDRYRQHLDNAVSSCLRTNSPVVATQLSSGYDSSAVTTTAALQLKCAKPLVAITAVPAPGLPLLVPMNRIADESAYAARTAETRGIDHLTVHDDEPLLRSINSAAFNFQEPVTNLFNIGWWTNVLNVARENRATTILCATMGNFTLSFGGTVVLPFLFRSGHLRAWWREARAATARNRNRWRGVLMTTFEAQLPQAVSTVMRRAFLGAPDPDRFSFVHQHLIGSRPPSPQVSGDLHTAQLAWFRRSDSGMFNKALLARTGVEQRDPTADRRLVEFCLTLPPDQLLRDGVYRPLARRALADRVPREILDLPVRGYQGADWFARLKRTDVEEALEEIEASSTATELLNIGKIQAAIEHWPSPERDSHDFIFAFGRALTNAIAAGKFIADIERNPAEFYG